MKKILLLAACFIISQGMFAQYCGNSGAFQCTVSGTITQPGLSPLSDSLPPFQNNTLSTTVIQFRNFNVIYYFGNTFTVNWLRIDSIENLPNGLCWASDKANNTYANSENGCIKVNGVPCDSTGQYKLRIIVTVDVGFTAQIDAETAGLRYYVRLNNPGDPIIAADTSTLAAFVPYGGTCQPTLPPTLSVDSDQLICTGGTARPHVTITNGQPPFTFSWQSIGDSLSCYNCDTPTAHLSQNSVFVLTITDAFNRTASDTVSYQVAGSIGNYNISPSGPTSFCHGDSVILYAHSNFTFSIIWRRGGIEIPGSMDDTTFVIKDTSGVYEVLFIGGGCTTTSNTITVTVNPNPTVSITPTGPIGICQGDNTQLQSTATGSVTYLWQLNGNNLNSATNPSYTASLAGAYRLVVRTTANCADTSNVVQVNVNPLPTVTLSGNPDTVCSNASAITLSGASPAGGTFNGIGITGSTFTPSTAGTGAHVISYSYTDANNCTNAATETILVKLCTGINNLNDEGTMMLFPNPVNNELNILCDLFNGKDETVKVFDVAGKNIACDYKFHDKGLTVRTNNLLPGSYFVKIYTGGVELGRKFVKID
jgi:hypothetical protein